MFSKARAKKTTILDCSYFYTPLKWLFYMICYLAMFWIASFIEQVALSNDLVGALSWSYLATPGGFRGYGVCEFGHQLPCFFTSAVSTDECDFFSFLV
jgi:hypothetical protein